jgi:hypothetical protein
MEPRWVRIERAVVNASAFAAFGVRQSNAGYMIVAHLCDDPDAWIPMSQAYETLKEVQEQLDKLAEALA